MTDTIEKKISSVTDLMAHLTADYAGYDGSVWYRGHAVESWELIPFYLRLRRPPSESTLLKRFKQSAAMLIDQAPKSSFDWMFLMQHYGVPTRLLDWTESPLVALYFAVSSADEKNSDAALWSLKPSELNKNANIHAEESNFIPSFDDEELTSYSMERLAQEKG